MKKLSESYLQKATFDNNKLFKKIRNYKMANYNLLL